MIPDLPVRVSRVGGAVETFAEPRRAHKKVGTDAHPKIATLTIPAGVRVTFPDSSGSWNGVSLRAERATVACIEDKRGQEYDAAPALHHDDFEYVLGESARPDRFDPDPAVHSTHGIHCFPVRVAAANYCRTEHGAWDAPEVVA